MRRIIYYLPHLLLPLIILSLDQGCYSKDIKVEKANAKLDGLYDKLRRLDLKGERAGYTKAMRMKRAEIARGFLQIGKPSIAYLIGKIERINQLEGQVFKSRDEVTPEELVNYFFRLRREQIPVSLKHDILFILAEMSKDHLDEQGLIIRIMIKSLAPPMYVRDTGGVYFWALLKVGRPIVSELIDLLNHPNETIRCLALSSLIRIRAESEDAYKLLPEEKSEAVLSFSYKCKASIEERREPIEMWRRWYNLHEKDIKVPVLPSWFD